VPSGVRHAERGQPLPVRVHRGRDRPLGGAARPDAGSVPGRVRHLDGAGLRVPETSQRLRDLPVFVDQAAEPIARYDTPTELELLNQIWAAQSLIGNHF
jgi:hypothetical protein